MTWLPFAFGIVCLAVAVYFSVAMSAAGLARDKAIEQSNDALARAKKAESDLLAANERANRALASASDSQSALIRSQQELQSLRESMPIADAFARAGNA